MDRADLASCPTLAKNAPNSPTSGLQSGLRSPPIEAAPSDLPPELVELVNAWPVLSDADKEVIRKIIRARRG